MFSSTSTILFFKYFYPAPNLVCRLSTKCGGGMQWWMQCSSFGENLCPLEASWQTAHPAAQTNCWKSTDRLQIAGKRKKKTRSARFDGKPPESLLELDSGTPTLLQKVGILKTLHLSKTVRIVLNGMHLLFSTCNYIRSLLNSFFFFFYFFSKEIR